MSRTAFIVEDESNIRELICATLSSGGFQAHGFESGMELFRALEQEQPAIFLLDIMLPGQSGLEILRKLKDNPEWRDIPVLFLTAKSQELDKVAGLELGADDYIVKPFGVLELLARVKAVLRRTEKPQLSQDNIFTYQDLTIDTLRKCILKNGEALPLTFKEYELFLYLYHNRGIVLSRDKLLGAVWNYDFEGETRTVDVHIRSLRQKIGDQKGGGNYIVTTRGYGYMLRKEDSPV